MKKLYTYVLLAMIWSCALFGFAGIGVLADDAYAGVFDDAGILTEEEKSGLSSQIQALETEYQIHLLIVTTEDTQGKEVVDYADDFFEEHNGDGTSGAGLLLLIDMQHSELYISTSGEDIIHTFTDTRLDSIMDDIYDEAVNSNFYGSCQQFLTGVDNVLGGPETSEMTETTAETESEIAPLSMGNIFDEAALFTESEVGKLEQRIGDLETKTGFRVLITTTNSTGGKTSHAYAENFFKSHNDSGKVSNGLVYLINMEAREIYVYAAGNSVTESFSEANIDKMLDRIYKKVEDGKYYKSCDVFLDNVERYGVEGGNKLTAGRLLFQLIACMIVGAVIVFFLARNRGGKVVAGVNNYFVAGGANEILHRDQFINRTVTRQRIKKDDDDNSRGNRSSGGSSVHRSSSGTMHGGSGRSFGGGSRGGGRKF